MAAVQADFVVVGAGSAGCATARRLAESGASVVVIEAGGPETAFGIKNLIDLPGAVAAMLATPRLKKLIDWGYTSVPQRHALDRTIPLTRGKVVGGSSSVNGMIFVRGARQNFDAWAADGCPGWSFDDVLPAFRRLEAWEDGSTALRGGDGPIAVRRQRPLTDSAATFLDGATTRLAVPFLEDYNGDEHEGIGAVQVSVDDGHRASAARGYLRTDPLENLLVLTHSHAVRVVVDHGRATGVLVIDDDGSLQTIEAEQEVIVAAGAYDSPKLLMLSGIGPAGHLREHGIDTIVDLPVGENLHDHLFVPISHRMDSAVRRPTALHFAHGLAKARLQRAGWASGSLFETTGFVRTSHAGTVPDLQLMSLNWTYPFPNQDSPKPIKPPTDKPGMSVFPTLIQPESRGSVRLASSDPSAAPLIDPGFLTSGRDTEVLLDGIAMVREVMAGLGDNQGEIVPGPEYADPGAIRKVLPDIVHTVYHPVGSCRMGSDERAVVDPRLRVRGIDRLRVADASVMPTITGGNTNAPSIMIGERCAEFILDPGGSTP